MVTTFWSCFRSVRNLCALKNRRNRTPHFTPLKNRSAHSCRLQLESLEERSVPSADLSLAKAASLLTPNVGQTQTWTLTLTNSGTDDANNIVVTDVLPAGMTYLSSTPLGSYDNNTSLWSIPLLTA